MNPPADLPPSDLPIGSPFKFDFNEFKSWYDENTKTLYAPALETFGRLVDEWLNNQLNDADRNRITLSGKRVKGATRLWAKIAKEKYREDIEYLDDIPLVVDDIIGIRLTCHNNCDMDTLFETLAALPSDNDDQMATLWTDPTSEKKYYSKPKASGYRAYHINLCTLSHTATGWVPVTAELQARTLLQDGWGELTHEDTYKPGMDLPPIASKLARRMADLLAAVDDLAQDLRDELDRIAADAVTDEDLPRRGEFTASQKQNTEASINPNFDSSDRDALVSETKQIIYGLSKPATLAEVAQRVQASFPQDLSRDWGGYRSFASLVEAAVPGAILSRTPPGRVFRPGSDALSHLISMDAAQDEFDKEHDYPDVVRRLRGADKKFPLLDERGWRELLGTLIEVLATPVWEQLNLNAEDPGLRELNALSRQASLLTQQRNGIVSRKYFDYTLKTLYFNGRLHPDVSQEVMCRWLADGFLRRSILLGLTSDPSVDYQSLSEYITCTECESGNSR